MATITLVVENDLAQAYEAASSEDQVKLQLLMGLRLRELTAPPSRPLSVIMDDIGMRAEALGLTQEHLETLLSEE